MGIENRTVTLENKCQEPRKENTASLKNMYTDVYDGAIYNNSDMKMNQRSITKSKSKAYD